ncbi:MAG: potassium/proton antiporter [Bacillota bacterium]
MGGYEGIQGMRVEHILLGAALLLLASLAASKGAGRLGVPALVLFLGVGMLAGSDGPGGLYFDDPWLAQVLGVAALVVILFAGGLHTEWRQVRPVLWPAVLLATVGVVITAVLVGAFGAAVLGFRPLEALLLGSVISSTDAAAVFAVLRSRRAALKGRLRPLLELESGTNDPLAVLLTLGLIHMISQEGARASDLVGLFAVQMAVGGALGYSLGRVMVELLRRVHFESDALYPVMSLALVFAVYGITASAWGSGFLAVYIAGLVVGNSSFVHRRNLMRFHDSTAWLAQILMFLTLGLLVFPTQVARVTGLGLAVAAFLMLVARPAAVLAILPFFRASLAEMLLVSWVGLRGAVPIILATLPRLAGIAEAQLIFNVVFFVVLTSALLQGTSIPYVARWLGVAAEAPPERRPPLELAAPENVHSDLIELIIPPESPAAGQPIAQLGLPAGALVVLVGRDNAYRVPSGSTTVHQGDILLILGHKAQLDEVRLRLGIQEEEPV